MTLLTLSLLVYFTVFSSVCFAGPPHDNDQPNVAEILAGVNVQHKDGMLGYMEDMNDNGQEVQIDVCMPSSGGYVCANGDKCGNATATDFDLNKFKNECQMIAGFPYHPSVPRYFRISHKNAICLSKRDGTTWLKCSCEDIIVQLFVVNTQFDDYQSNKGKQDDSGRGIPISQKDDLSESFTISMSGTVTALGWGKPAWERWERWKYQNSRMSTMDNFVIHVPEAANELAAKVKTENDFMKDQQVKDELRRQDEERAIQDGELKAAFDRRTKVDALVLKEITEKTDEIKSQKLAEIEQQKKEKEQKLKDARDARTKRDDALKMELMTLDQEIKDANDELNDLNKALATLQEQKRLKSMQSFSVNDNDSDSTDDSGTN